MEHEGRSISFGPYLEDKLTRLMARMDNTLHIHSKKDWPAHDNELVLVATLAPFVENFHNLIQDNIYKPIDCSDEDFDFNL